MTTAPNTSAKPAKRPRGEGQWALGYREPLNPNEQSKKDDNPLNVRARIEDIYSKNGFESIDKGDLRGRFRWWGLYTRQVGGIEEGGTARTKTSVSTSPQDRQHHPAPAEGSPNNATVGLLLSCSHKLHAQG